MLENISLYDDTEISLWDEFVKSHPNGTPFHLSSWLRTIYETYLFKPFMYVYRNDNRVITGIFPCFLIKNVLTGKRIVSLPFSDYGGPLLNQHFGEKDFLKEIIMALGPMGKYIEIRSSLNENCGYFAQSYYKRHVLNLQLDLSDIKKGINKRTILYSIRKSKKLGVEIREENNQYGMDEFYRLNILTRKKHRIPFQPKRFFNKLLEHIILKGNGFILLANYDSKVIAASIFFKLERQIYYKYNASDPEYLKKVNPNHLITWHAIERGVTEGFHSLDFGRTSPDNEGLIRYKEMWGMRTNDLNYNYYPKVKGIGSAKESGWLFRFLTGVWSSLPDTIKVKISPMIYKHLG